MTITLHTWTPADKPALMALCNAVDRTFLSDRLPEPYTDDDVKGGEVMDVRVYVKA